MYLTFIESPLPNEGMDLFLGPPLRSTPPPEWSIVRKTSEFPTELVKKFFKLIASDNLG